MYLFELEFSSFWDICPGLGLLQPELEGPRSQRVAARIKRVSYFTLLFLPGHLPIQIMGHDNMEEGGLKLW